MKQNLIDYIKACQEAVDNSPENEQWVALDMGAMGVTLSMNNKQDLLKELIFELSNNYSVVKHFGTIIN